MRGTRYDVSSAFTCSFTYPGTRHVGSMFDDDRNMMNEGRGLSGFQGRVGVRVGYGLGIHLAQPRLRQLQRAVPEVEPFAGLARVVAHARVQRL